MKVKTSVNMLATAAIVVASSIVGLATATENVDKYLFEKGMTALNSDSPLQAIAAFNLLSEMDSELEALSRFYMGVALLKVGQDEQAQVEFALALRRGLPIEEATLARSYIAQLTRRDFVEDSEQPPKKLREKQAQVTLLFKMESLDGVSLIPTLENLLTPVRDKDSRFQVLASFAYFIKQTAVDSLTAGYVMNSFNYSDRDDLNSRNHSIFLSGQTLVGDGVSVGGDLVFTMNRVDQESLARIYTANGYVSFPGFRDKAMRVGYKHSYLDYITADQLDTNINTLSLTQRIMAKQTAYTDVGVSYTYADANDSTFSYDGVTLSMNGYWAVDPQQGLTWSIAHDWIDYRGFDNIESDVRREDQIWRLNAAYSYQFAPAAALVLDAQWRDNKSNLIRQDYISRNIGLGLQVIF